MFWKFFRKKRKAISPVIAAILLIGLAVLAGAAVIVVVVPLLEARSNLGVVSAYVYYDADLTQTRHDGNGYGKAVITVSNSGTEMVKITNIEVAYLDETLGTWETISDAVSLQGISTSEPYEIQSLATEVDLSMSFKIPAANLDQSVTYRIRIYENDKFWDTSREEKVSEVDMTLSADRPSISSIGVSSGSYVRRTYTISPSVSDNAGIQKVIFHVYNSSYSVEETITSSPWRWQWDTKKTATDGLSNGTYTINVTVVDWADNSISSLDVSDIGAVSIIVDNDYMAPSITNVQGSSTKNGPGIAEVGEFYSVSATIKDFGSQVSDVDAAYIHYKLNDSSTVYTTAAMTEGSNNVWTGNIPASFIDSDALDNNITYYITAVDDDSNTKEKTDIPVVGVKDTTSPDFTSHTPITVADEGVSIELNVTVEDKDAVASVTLYYREHNNTGIEALGSFVSVAGTSGSSNTWAFEIPNYNVTLDGVDYYLVAVDDTGNIAYDGNATSYYAINVPDKVDPAMDILNPDPMPDTITDGTDLTITVQIKDNDPTFSIFSTRINESGTVQIAFRVSGEAQFTYVDMTHTSGNSSETHRTGTWEGTIDGGNFTTLNSPVEVRIIAQDKVGNQDTSFHSIDVVPTGEPILAYVSNSVAVSGSSDHILEFDIENQASTSQPATATINSIKVTLINSSKYGYKSGLPFITQINSSGGGEVWSNSTNTEGANDTKLTLDSTFDIKEGYTVTLTLVYANSSGGYYNVNDFIVNVTLYYTYGSSSDIQSVDFKTPVTTYLFSDNWDGGTADAWQVDSRSSTGASFSAVSGIYRGDATGSSAYNVWTWIDGEKFTIPFEIVIRIYPYSTSTNQMAFIVFANTMTDDTLFAAGARVGAQQARVSRYTVSTDTWVQDDSQSYTWSLDTWQWMKISIDSGKTIYVYSENSGSWNLRSSYTQSLLPDSVYVGLFIDYALTDFDDMTIYNYGDAPDASELPTVPPVVNMASYSDVSNIADSEPIETVITSANIVTRKRD